MPHLGLPRVTVSPGGSLKLFHSVVVMGAALTACGGQSVEPTVLSDPPSGGGSGGPSGVGGTGAAGGVSGGSAVGAGAGSGGTVIVIEPPVPLCERPGGGSAEAPLGPADCAHPQEFTCAGSCVCSTAAPLEPADCANTVEFHCLDWSLPCGCSCIAGSPTSDDACPGRWQCQSYDPPVGCGCIAPPIL